MRSSPKWNLRKVDGKLIDQVVQEYKVPEPIARIMASRGIIERSVVRAFFNPQQEQLYDPHLMKGMDMAVSRILDQLQNGHRILIFGDYDVDGTSAAALLTLFLRSVEGDVQYYIPTRETEGYGLSKTGIDYAAGIGATLLITCDCGINAVEQVEYANSKSIDVIVTDHHNPDTQLPAAYSILNPKQKDCSYPFTGLCGCGVAFKLVQAICDTGQFDPDLAWRHVDLVALGSAADLVPVVDENRVLISLGLQQITAGAKPGIAALIQESGFAGREITVGRLVFWIAPKLNAAGRLGDAGRAVKLMITDNPAFAKKMAAELERENKKRQVLTEQMVTEAATIVQQSSNLDSDCAIVLARRGWHAGVIGIVASRIREMFHRPVFIISIDEDGIGHGSGRSIPALDLYTSLQKCSDHLVGFGGHTVAAGLTLQEEQFEAFREQFLLTAAQSLTMADLEPRITVDTPLQLTEITPRIMKFLKTLAPYGPGNMRPKFMAKNIRVNGIPRLVGRDQNVLQLKLMESKSCYSAVGFNMADHYEKLIQNQPINIVFEIGENVWNGVISTQLELLDIHAVE